MKKKIPAQKLEPWEKELQQEAHRALDWKIRHGGARAGAGRKPKDYVKTVLNLSPQARKKLEKLAGEGSLSEAANKVLAKA